VRQAREDGARMATRGKQLMTLVSAAALCGCTSLVRITSEPSGARVWIDGVMCGVTPLETVVTHYPTYRNRIVLDHPGCEPLSTTLRRALRLGFKEGDDQMNILRGYGVAVLSIYTLGTGLGFFVAPVEEQHFLLAPRREGPNGGALRNDPAPRYGLAGWAEELRVRGGGR